MENMDIQIVYNLVIVYLLNCNRAMYIYCIYYIYASKFNLRLINAAFNRNRLLHWYISLSNILNIW